MNSIESQFVPYEIAVKLKELGFTDYHISGWYIKDDGSSFSKSFHLSGNKSFIYYQEHCVKAPLFSQAFDWFRFEHGLESFITPVLDADHIIHQYSFIICSFGMQMYEFSQQLDEGDFDTYESSRLACLEKLIELVTDKIK